MTTFNAYKNLYKPAFYYPTAQGYTLDLFLPVQVGSRQLAASPHHNVQDEQINLIFKAGSGFEMSSSICSWSRWNPSGSKYSSSAITAHELITEQEQRRNRQTSILHLGSFTS
ncbi:hypothetical protein EVAR_5995_1 [Eumeta japonica]|uniref:Uncharacterized protein n=1 Tax=Eumeta variegata TaxID=151549 RepID=A0A4C1TCX7_EUMVA|nr:hypothetical protein EVAR_5995_1 [Eumeta japonica]